MTEAEALELHSRAQELQSAGRHAQASGILARVAGYFESEEGPDSLDLANVLADWAESLSALCLYQEAEAAARRSTQILDRLEHLLDPETHAALVPRAALALGRSLREQGRYEEAATHLRRALAECERIHGAADPETASYLDEYGILCKYWGRYDEGEGCYRKALKIQEDRFGPESPETATIYHNLGGICHARGDFARGEPLAHTAYRIRRMALGADHPDTVADEVAWAGLLDGCERYDESVPIYVRALDFYERHFGPEHFEVAAVLNNLGMARAAQGNTSLTRLHLERCVAIKRKLFAAGHPELQLSEANLRTICEA